MAEGPYVAMCVQVPGITLQETLQKMFEAEALLLLGSTCFPETLLKSPKGELLIDEIDSVLKSQSSCVHRLIDEDHMAALKSQFLCETKGVRQDEKKHVSFVLTVGATTSQVHVSAMHFIFRISCSAACRLLFYSDHHGAEVVALQAQSFNWPPHLQIPPIARDFVCRLLTKNRKRCLATPAPPRTLQRND